VHEILSLSSWLVLRAVGRSFAGIPLPFGNPPPAEQFSQPEDH
jgi:hypothetical protein